LDEVAAAQDAAAVTTVAHHDHRARLALAW
jgi:hypothetical protein